jgi:hypothetical protein
VNHQNHPSHREDDDVKVDNVVCRTPARNAQNLDAVKNEILEMVDRAVCLASSLHVYFHADFDQRILSTRPRLSALTVSTTES